VSHRSISWILANLTKGRVKLSLDIKGTLVQSREIAFVASAATGIAGARLLPTLAGAARRRRSFVPALRQTVFPQRGEML